MNDDLISFGRARPERADAARNRERLLAVAREMIAEDGVEKLTMDGLAERAGLGKGTVFRRFKTRAGIFVALITDDEKAFQLAALSGPPPLGPGADAVARLVAYGRARIDFLFDHHALVRGTVERYQPVPVRGDSMSGMHIRVLLAQAQREGVLRIPDATTTNTLAIQLTAALEGPLLLYLAAEEDVSLTTARRTALSDSWQFLIERITGSEPGREDAHAGGNGHGDGSRS